MRATIGAAIAAVFAAVPAYAQEPAGRVTSAERMTQVASSLGALDDVLAQHSERYGGDWRPFTPIILPLLDRAHTILPPGDDYTFDIDYDFAFEPLTDQTLFAELDPIFSDAQACAAANGDRRVIRFERVIIPGGGGHRCITLGPDVAEPGWTFQSDTVVRTADRQMMVQSRGIATTDDAGRAEAVVEHQAGALTEVAIALDMHVVENFLLLKTPAQLASERGAQE